MKAGLILATQLLEYHPALTDASVDLIIMVEAKDVSSTRLYHRHKLILLFSAMRHYREIVTKHNKKLIYLDMTDTPVYKDSVAKVIIANQVDELVWMTSSDLPTNTHLTNLCKSLGITSTQYPNGLFMTPEADVREWFEKHPKAVMETFYRWQRQRTGILTEGTLPIGGKWNFDEENRQPLPKKGLIIPEITLPVIDSITEEVIKMVNAEFAVNPGSGADFWLPVTHDAARDWLEQFITERFDQFGPYEDAMKDSEPFLFHGVLSPLLNCGLLSVGQVVKAALDAYSNDQARLSSVEGFIRQITGWREYMYGMYLSRPEMKDENYFGFTKQLEDWWYSEDALMQDLPPPVVGALRTVMKYGYNHHIERLMILGNWFLLNEYDPKSVYAWFSSLYVDAYEWVMVPNVMGMSQYADGGKTATKPYISGGNYLHKMGRWWPSTADAQKSEFTQMYWKFLENNYDLLKKNHRMALVLKRVEPTRR
ncbi:cryptochrome/photolyase family protein [Candidatus Saccharibacteria bacterium]|nr:cryptochrome/photolyase family protein [Candidatus Saccharibacteria bacterium]